MESKTLQKPLKEEGTQNQVTYVEIRKSKDVNSTLGSKDRALRAGWLILGSLVHR